VTGASTIAADFARGNSSPSNVLAEVLAQIRRRDPAVQACNSIVEESELRAQARAADERWAAGSPLSALDGIPFGVKANIAIKGLPWHAGIAAFRERIAEQDAEVVAVMRAAGMIPLAILNMHEAALGASSQNHAFQCTRNPRDLTRIPGGSSGGSAAAVAAGMLPIALGTDDLGSVRLPSALCGVVGYKPPHGMLPVAGVVPLSKRLDHVGVHAMSVQDVTAVMNLFRKPHTAEPMPLKSWQFELAPDAEIAQIVEIETTGVADWRDVDMSRVRRAGLVICEDEASHHFERDVTDHSEGFSREFIAGIEWVRKQTAEKKQAAGALLDGISKRLRTDVDGFLLVCATSPHVAPLIDEVPPVTLADFTGPAAIAGLPSISIPVGNTPAGLPVGLQITGQREADVLGAADKLMRISKA